MSVISRLPQRSGWTRVPFGRVANRVKNCGRSELEPLSVFLDDGVVPRSSRNDNHNQLGEDLGRYLIVQPGDIVFNKLRTWQGGLGVSKYTGIVSPAYFVCRPNEDYEPRFLHYLLRSTIYLQELTRISKWQPPAQFDIGWEQLRGVQISAPSKERQIAIADYLDTETARIDALIGRKQELNGLLEEFEISVIDHTFASQSLPTSRMKYVAKLNPESLSESTDPGTEIRYVDIGSVWRGNLVSQPDEMSFGDAPSRARRVVRGGDVIVSTVRTYLRAVWAVPESCSGVVVSTGFAVLRPSECINPTFLSLYCRSSYFIEQVVAHSVGVSYPGVNAEEIMALPVPLPDVAYQEEAVEGVVKRLEDSARVRTLLNKQIDLLRLRRNSLVTSAVAGEIQTPGVAA